MNSLVFVAVGGAVGACMRYGVNLLAVATLGKSFPYATLMVNVIGSFLMGVLFSALEHGIIADVHWRSLLGIGLLGAFTTFSTFSLDTVLLMQHGEWQKALLNVLLNLFVCLGAVWLGIQTMAFKYG